MTKRITNIMMIVLSLIFSVGIFLNCIGVKAADATNGRIEKPVRVKIIAGMNYNVALKEDSTVWCWGGNTFGELGDGSNKNSNLPVQTKELNNVIDIAVGDSHALALKRDGTVWAWGLNSSGQLGDGTTDKRNIPVPVKDMDNVVLIAANKSVSLAVKEDGSVWYWGGSNGNSNISPKYFLKVEDAYDVINIDSKAFFLKSDKSLWMTDLMSVKNGIIRFSNEEISLSAKGNQRFAVNSSGMVKTAIPQYKTVFNEPKTEYYVYFNQIIPRVNAGTTIDLSKLDVVQSGVMIATASAITSCSMNNNCFLAVDKDGQLYFWGYNKYFDSHVYDVLAINVPRDLNTIIKVESIKDVEDTSIGFKHVVATKKDGTVWCWGDNQFGQLGNGTNVSGFTPVQVKDFVLFEKKRNSLNTGNTTQQAISSQTTASAIAPLTTSAVSSSTTKGAITEKQKMSEKILLKISNKVISSNKYIYNSEKDLKVQASLIAKELGAKYSWDSGKKTILISKGNEKIKMAIGSKTAYVNGKKVMLDCAPVLKDVPYVPAKFVAIQLGCKYAFDEKTMLVDIKNK